MVQLQLHLTPAFHFITGVPLKLGDNIGSFITIPLQERSSPVLCSTVTGSNIEYYVTYAIGTSR